MKVYIVCRYDNYELRIQYVEKYFILRGADVTIITGDYNHITKRKAEYKYNYDNIKYIHVNQYKRNVSFARIYADAKFSFDALKEIKLNKPDIIYAIIPPNMLVKKLSEYKKANPSTILICDIFDLWPESFPSVFISNIGLWKDLRNKYISKSDHVFIECGYYKYFLDGYINSDKMSVLYLTKKNNHIKKEYPGDDILNFLYLGSINSIIDIDEIVEFLKKMTQSRRICFHIIGTGNRKTELLQKLESEKINYEDYGIVYDNDEKGKIYSKCHYALNIYRKGVKIGLTMKSLDYFQNHIPVITKNIVDTGNLIKDYSCGFCLDSEDMDSVVKKIVNTSSEEWTVLSENSEKLMDDCFSEESFYSTFDNNIRKIMKFREG